MSNVIAQVVLQRDTGLPADVITNTMHFEDDSGFGTSAGIETNGPGLMDRIETFYKAIQGILGMTLSGAGKVTLYDWSAPTPRVPAMSKDFTFTPAAAVLPGEVALVLSYQAAAIAGVPAGRRRGRIYLGPLSTDIVSTPSGAAGSGDADPRPSAAALNTVLTAGKAMATGGSGAFRLSVFSPTALAGGASQDAAWNDVVSMTCDNSFDTVRSRGAAKTARHRILIAGSAAPGPG